MTIEVDMTSSSRVDVDLHPEDMSILIVDDDKNSLNAMAEGLRRVGYEVFTATHGALGKHILQERPVHLIIADLILPDADGIDLVRLAKRKDPNLGVIMVTGHSTIESAVLALREGADDYLMKPINLEELRHVTRRILTRQQLALENVGLRRQLDEKYGFENIVGNTPVMQQIFTRIRQIAPTNSTVLITGESGTGKELIAAAIHRNSPRENKAFIPVNCGALAQGVLESELFGHEKGAFTGAQYLKKGRFEMADGGTIFLDEVSELPLSAQVKLLRVLENREVMRVGGMKPFNVDVRVISATNKDLEELVRDGSFREDLYYRLKVISINLPPLRERTADIPLLAHKFLKELSELNNKNITGFMPDTMNILKRSPWPGNIRELRNAIESAVVISAGEYIKPSDLPIELLDNSIPAIQGTTKKEVDTLSTTASGNRTLAEIEKEAIANTLANVNGNRRKAADILGIGLRTLYRKIKEYEL